MRRLALLLTVVLAACGRSPDAGVVTGGTASSTSGPDAILLRFSRTGGTARAYRWWRDSVIWTSTHRAPPLGDAIAFDAQQGILMMLDVARMPVRIDLRVGSVAPATTERLRAISSADGFSVFGVAPGGEVVRLTNGGVWRFRPPAPVRTLLPLPDGALLILSDAGDGRVTIRKVHPPQARVSDSTTIAGADLVIPTAIGDRVYFAAGDHLEGLRTSDLSRSLTVSFDNTVRAVAPTPSGDRLFVAVQDSPVLYVVDRYESAVRDRVTLPDSPTALRMDPDGQFLLARSANGDSAHIVAIGTQRAIGTVATAWRADLPLIAPDGGLALADNDALVIVDAETKRERLRMPNGAADLWVLARWNGFRPRSASLDVPVRFVDEFAVSLAADSLATSLEAPVPAPSEVPNPVPPLAARAELKGHGWMLSFAAVLSESRARTMVAAMRVEGATPRVQANERDGTTVYRVVAGPYGTREAAEEAGRRSGLPYWVFEVAP
ncbi:MAG TPA: SPOR domain-containing protein [Gemmatimonadaceae bacterium]